jgi:hypothetical protein
MLKAQKATRAADLHTYKENLCASKDNITSTPAPITPAKPLPKPIAPAKDWKHEYRKLS